MPQVEIWLHQLTNEMKNTLKRLVDDCVKEEVLDPKKYPSQVCNMNFFLNSLIKIALLNRYFACANKFVFVKMLNDVFVVDLLQHLQI